MGPLIPALLALMPAVAPALAQSAFDFPRAETALKTYELTSARAASARDRVESDAERVLRGAAPPKQEVPPPGGPR